MVRLGRVQVSTPRLVETDSPLISGDSGGPLFDLDGRLIGINSRIGRGFHWRISMCRLIRLWRRGTGWRRGMSGWMSSVFIDLFGVSPGRGSRGTRSVAGISDEKGMKLTGVIDGSPAKRGGLQVGDVIHPKLNGETIATAEDLAAGGWRSTICRGSR